MSCCRSSGFNYHPCSQSQKMSIGIVVESVAKPGCGTIEEADVSIRAAEKETSDGEHLVVMHNAQRGVKFAGSVKMMCKNDVADSVGVTAADPNENQASKPTHMMQSFVNQALLEPGVGKKAEPDRVSGKERKRAFMDETSEKFSSAPKQKMCLPVKDVLVDQPNEMENRSKEVLRMKLRELLGAAPSGNKPASDSRTCEVNTYDIMTKQTLKGDAHFKPWQNSDTIETDSENMDMTIKRPVTRALARRAAARMQPRSFKPKSLSSDKEKHQSSDIFTFAEKSAPSMPCIVNRSFLLVEKNDRAKRSYGIKPGDMLSPLTDMRSIQPQMSGCDKTPHAEKLPCSGGKMFFNQGSGDENTEPEAPMQNKDFNNSPAAREKSLLPNAESPAPQENLECFEPFGGQSPMPHVDDFSCPWFRMTKSVLNSPMDAYPLTNNDKKQNVHVPAQPEEGILLKTTSLFKSNTVSEKDIYESSDDGAKIEDAPSNTPELFIEEKDAEKGLVTPAKGELDSTEEVSSANKVYTEVNDVHTSPENEIRHVCRPVLFQSKRHCSHGVDFSDFSPTLHTPKGSGNAGDVLTECLDESPEDGLARVVSLLGLALEKVKTKMVSVTNKKCSEILVSAAEEIHSQLQNIDSQIQADLRKLTSLKTSKRKHLETRLQEQQEHLKIVQQKFKEEICQYLQDCKGALDGLETQHIELRGAIEKQKALHRKLLMQMEATVETQLTDAQRQMMFVCKLGKQKMQQLKVTIAECLKDGIFH